MRKPLLRLVALVIGTVMITACGGSAQQPAATSATTDGGDGGDKATEPTPVRFLIAPDPLWDYMVAEGLVNEYERKYNLDIQQTSSWDEFTFFAGGHGDIVSLGTLELPILEQETGIDTVTFGRYNGFRSTPTARCDTGWETLADVPPGSRVGVNSPVSATILWDIYAREVHGFPFAVDHPDNPFDMFVEDHFVLGETLLAGDLDMAVAIPEAIIEGLVSGEFCIMYGGRPSWQVMTDLLPNQDHKGILSNGFTSTKEFYEQHPEAVAAFLALWEEGLRRWDENVRSIVETYPQHFSVDSEEGIDWIVDYLQSDKDYFADTVYLTEEWIENETMIYDLMKKHELMEEDAEIPEFVVVDPIE